jgi:hypothetical protein
MIHLVSIELVEISVMFVQLGILTAQECQEIEVKVKAQQESMENIDHNIIQIIEILVNV